MCVEQSGLLSIQYYRLYRTEQIFKDESLKVFLLVPFQSQKLQTKKFGG